MATKPYPNSNIPATRPASQQAWLHEPSDRTHDVSTTVIEDRIQGLNFPEDLLLTICVGKDHGPWQELLEIKFPHDKQDANDCKEDIRLVKLPIPSAC